MGIELGTPVSRGQRLYRAMVAATMAMPLGERMQLLRVFQGGGSFAQLSPGLRQTFEDVANAVIG